MKNGLKNSPVKTGKYKNIWVLLGLFLVMAVSGCGNKGDLYHPPEDLVNSLDKPTEQVTTHVLELSI